MTFAFIAAGVLIVVITAVMYSRGLFGAPKEEKSSGVVEMEPAASSSASDWGLNDAAAAAARGEKPNLGSSGDPESPKE